MDGRQTQTHARKRQHADKQGVNAQCMDGRRQWHTSFRFPSPIRALPLLHTSLSPYPHYRRSRQSAATLSSGYGGGSRPIISVRSILTSSLTSYYEYRSLNVERRHMPICLVKSIVSDDGDMGLVVGGDIYERVKVGETLRCKPSSYSPPHRYVIIETLRICKHLILRLVNDIVEMLSESSYVNKKRL